MNILFGFLTALALMMLPWGLAFLPAGAMFLPIFFLASAGVLVGLLFYYVGKGDAYGAIGALLAPLLLWLIFEVTIKRPGAENALHCHDDATTIQPASVQNPKWIYLDNFAGRPQSFRGVDAEVYLALLTGADITFFISRYQQNYPSYIYKPEQPAECRIKPEDREKGYLHNVRHFDTVLFENKNRTIDQCIKKQSIGAGPRNAAPKSIVFRREEGSFGCEAIDIFEVDVNGEDKKLGRVKHFLRDNSMYPELRRADEKSDQRLLFYIARAVFGEKISANMLQRHFIN